jgi:hypothetical protein
LVRKKSTEVGLVFSQKRNGNVLHNIPYLRPLTSRLS